MSHEAGIPGDKVSNEHLQMICCRYFTASQYVQGKQVLEVGCGTGLGLGYLSKRARSVIAGDYSEDNLRGAHQHYRGRIKLLLLDAHELPFRDGCFDIVIAMEVILYCYLERFLDECHRVLKRDGTLALCLPNKDVPGFHRSPLSRSYYSIPELLTSLNRHHFNAELFGAFPIPRGATQQKLYSAMIVRGGEILDLMPKGRKVKDFLNKIVLGRNVILKEELEKADMMAKNFQLAPLPGDSPDFRYRILYAIAQAQ